MYCRLRNLHLEPGQSPIVSFDLIYYERQIPLREALRRRYASSLSIRITADK